MALLDGILGGGNESSSDSANVSSTSDSSNFDFATDPNLGVNASDILQSFDSSQDGDGGSDTSAFSGIGDLGIDLSSPTAFSSSSSSDSFDASSNQSDSDGGLLQGLI